jgi:hypothetical protein
VRRGRGRGGEGGGGALLIAHSGIFPLAPPRNVIRARHLEQDRRRSYGGGVQRYIWL